MIQKGNEKLKIYLFAQNMILYIKYLKNFIKKLQLIIIVSKVVGYKLNTHCSLAFYMQVTIILGKK